MLFAAPAGQSLATLVAWTLLHSLWQGAAIWATFRLCRAATTNAATRVRLAHVALIVFAVAQLATVALLLNNTWVSPQPAGLLMGEAPQVVPEKGRYFFPPNGQPSRIRAYIEAAAPALPWIAVGWGCGATYRAFLVLLAWRQLRRGTRAAGEVDAKARQRFAAIAERLGLAGRVRFVLSNLTTVPATAGWLRPIVYLPLSSMTMMPPHQLDAIIAHELAHVARNDFLTSLVREALRSLYYFHPSIASICRFAAQDAEEATDDLAASVVGSPRAYAAALVTLVDVQRQAALALRATGGAMIQRVRRLTQPAVGDARPRRLNLGGSIVGGAVTLLFLGGLSVEQAAANRMRSWLDTHTFAQAVAQVLATDRPNAAFEATLATLVTIVRTEGALSTQHEPLLFRLASEACDGVPVGAADYVAHPQLAEAAGVAAGHTAERLGLPAERAVIIRQLMALVDRAEDPTEQAVYARGALLVSALETEAKVADAGLVHLLQPIATHHALALTSSQSNVINAAFFVEVRRRQLVYQAMARHGAVAAPAAVIDTLRYMPLAQRNWVRVGAADDVNALLEEATHRPPADQQRLAFLMNRVPR